MPKLSNAYTRCHQCSFNVTKQDKTCSNCGIERPQTIFNPGLLLSANFEQLYMTWIVSLSLSAILGVAFLAHSIGGGAYVGYILLYFLALLIASVVAAIAQDPYLTGLAVVVALPAIGIIIPTSILGSTVAFTVSKIKSKNPCLSLEEDRIRKNLESIGEQVSQVDLLIQDIKARSTSEALHKARKNLNIKKDSLLHLSDRYGVKRSQLEVIRWSNSVESLLYLEKASYSNHLKKLQRIEEQGRKLLSSFGSVVIFDKNSYRFSKQSRLINLSESKDGAIVVQKTRNVLAVLDQVIERVITDRAYLETKDFSPIRVFSNMINDLSVEQIDLLDARRSVGEFSANLEEMTIEYERLQAEVELS